MNIRITRLVPFNGRVHPEHPESGRGVCNFNAVIDDQISIRQGILRELPSGSYRIRLKDGPAVTGLRCVALRDGPIRDAVTEAVAQAYLSLTQQVAA